MTFARTFRRGDRVQVHAGTCVPCGAYVHGTFLRGCGSDGVMCVVNIDGAGQQAVPSSGLRHAPVTVIGPVPPAAPEHCPQCGQPLTVDSSAVRFTPRAGAPALRTQVMVAACGFCDFIQEVAK